MGIITPAPTNQSEAVKVGNQTWLTGTNDRGCESLYYSDNGIDFHFHRVAMWKGEASRFINEMVSHMNLYKKA